MTQQQKQNLSIFLGAVVIIGGLTWAYETYQSKKIADAAWPTLDGGVYASAVTRNGVSSLIPGDELYKSGVVEGGIPSLTNPKYASVLASDAVIADELFGIDLAIGGDHRFYPVQVMNWHEVVNDTIDGKDVAITYCPLCGTGVVYNRAVDAIEGEEDQEDTDGKTLLTFSVTGKVYNNNTVLKDDQTGSLWLQATGESIQGSMIGKTLEVIPSRMMAWKDWKAMYPSGFVLSTNTGITRDYTRHPYGNYDTSKGVYFPLNHMDPNFGSKWVVYGVSEGENGLGFSEIALKGTGMMHAKLGEKDVIAVYDFATDTAHVFETKSQNGDVHTFTYDYAKKLLLDEQKGIWNGVTGVDMLSSSMNSLIEVPVIRGFWFCLAAMHPTWKAVLTNEPVTP